MHPRLRSECGKFFCELAGRDCWHYRLFDAEGRLLGESTFWSNHYTDSRIRFETGFGETRAFFSYVRHPRWFHRRWVEIWKIDAEKLKAIIADAGAESLVYFKPSMNCYHHVGFRATGSQAKWIDFTLAAAGVKFKKNMKVGFSIECPDDARWPQGEALCKY